MSTHNMFLWRNKKYKYFWIEESILSRIKSYAFFYLKSIDIFQIFFLREM